MLSHNHPVTIRLKGRKLRVCARCLGVVLGFLALTLTIKLYSLTFFQKLSFPYQLTICLILASPAIVDWVTQKWGIRESNNSLRVFTGFFEGLAAVLLYLSAAPLTQKILILLFVEALTLNIGFAGERLLKKGIFVHYTA